MNIYEMNVKRIIDFLVAFCGLIVLSPAILIIALIIRKEDGGKAFYRGDRLGKDGIPFRIYKFRTMVMNAENVGGSSTPLDDPRITKIGLFLRRYKLDELPQLISIIKGDMSLVGPRPQVPWALNMEDPVNQIILRVRPGLTDYASVRFHNEGKLLKGASNPDKAYFELIHPEKMRLAKEYVESVTLKTDLKLMGMTVLTVLKRGEERMASEELKEVGGFRTDAERIATGKYSDVFDNSQDSTQIKLQDFTKYIRRQDMTRLLSRYEIFKKAINVKGSVIECGVFRGFGLMCWALFSEILEPVNLTRRIYGFDNFEGTKRTCAKDENSVRTAKDGDFYTDAYNELLSLIQVFDENRFLGHLNKVSLINGDAAETIPRFIEENPHLLISLLFLDFDLYEPTKIALKHLLPRMPKGAIVAFDELDNPIWPGETLALLETKNINKLEIRRLDFDPYIGYAVIDA